MTLAEAIALVMADAQELFPGETLDRREMCSKVRTLSAPLILLCIANVDVREAYFQVKYASDDDLNAALGDE